MILLDTHALVWWVTGDRRLSAPARRAINGAPRAGPVMASAEGMLELDKALRRDRLLLRAVVEACAQATRERGKIEPGPFS